MPRRPRRSRLGGSRGVPVLVPVRASPVPRVVRGNLLQNSFFQQTGSDWHYERQERLLVFNEQKSLSEKLRHRQQAKECYNQTPSHDTRHGNSRTAGHVSRWRVRYIHITFAWAVGVPRPSCLLSPDHVALRLKFLVCKIICLRFGIWRLSNSLFILLTLDTCAAVLELVPVCAPAASPQSQSPCPVSKCCERSKEFGMAAPQLSPASQDQTPRTGAGRETRPALR